MKYLLTSIIICLITLSAHAQTEAGGGFAGGNAGLSFSSYRGLSTANEFNFSVSPTAGFFVAKNFAIGAYLTYSLSYFTSGNGNSTISNLGLGPIFRPYINIGSRTKLFFDGRIGGGTAIYTSKSSGTRSSTNIGFISGQVAPGIAAFVAPNVAFEMMAGYYGEKKLPRGGIIVPYTVTHRIFISLGLQVYFPRKKAVITTPLEPAQ